MEDERISCRVFFVGESPFGVLPPEVWSFGASPPCAEVEIDKLHFPMLRLTGGLELTKHLRAGHVRVISGDRNHALAVVAALADSVYPLRDRSEVFDAFADALPIDAAIMRGSEAELARGFPAWSLRRSRKSASRARPSPPLPFIGLPSFCNQNWCADILAFRASLLNIKPPRSRKSERDPIGWLSARLEEVLPTVLAGDDTTDPPGTIEVRSVPDDLAAALRSSGKADWRRTAAAYADAPTGRAWTAHLMRTGAAIRELAIDAHREQQRLWLWTRFE